MTREQAERKAKELYPVSSETRIVPRIIAKERAAFMQCFDLMPTGSLPMTREDAVNWIEGKFPKGEEERIDQLMNGSGRRGGMRMFDHLASLSSAAPAPVGVTREDITELFRTFTKYVLANTHLAPQVTDRSLNYYGDTFAWVRDRFMPALAAPVSSAAQPATGYSEDQVREIANKLFAFCGLPSERQQYLDEIISSLNQK